MPLSNLINGSSGVIWPKPSLYRASFQDPELHHKITRPEDEDDVEMMILEAIEAVYKEV
jgi:hypothetical protein